MTETLPVNMDGQVGHPSPNAGASEAGASARAQSAVRDQAVLRTAAVSVATRAFSIVASLLTVPLVLNHVGTERYGVWLTALAIATLFTLADGGVTKGLILAVAKASGHGDRGRIKTLVSSAMAATIGISAACLAVTLAAVWLIDWRWAFNLSSATAGIEAAATISVICFIYAIAFIPTVIRETRLGLLQGAAVNAWDFGGTVLSFAGLVFAIRCGWGLVAIAAVYAGGALVARTASAMMFLRGPGRDLLPVTSSVDWATGRMLLGAGSVFMVYMLTQTLAVQSDQVLIARYLGASAVADYSVVQRLFNQPQILVTLALAAQWPAYGEALGRGDFAWIKRQFNRSLIGFTAFAVVASALLAVACPAILKAWVGDLISAPAHLILAMAVYGVVATIANVFSFFYLSLGMHARMITTQLAMFAINLPLTIVLLPLVGTVGAIIGTTAGYLLAIVLPGMLMQNRLFNELASLRGSTLDRNGTQIDQASMGVTATPARVE